MRQLLAVGVAAVLAGGAAAQMPAKAGPEHDVLKAHVGTWDTSMAAGGQTFKGTAVYKMDLGGLWLTSTMDGEMFGEKYLGRGMDTYDAAKKKYVGYWFDSMGTQPVVMEGTYDKGTKTLTMEGTGMGMDGKSAKYKSTSVQPDADTIVFTMYMGDVKEPGFVITYKRKK